MKSSAHPSNYCATNVKTTAQSTKMNEETKTKSQYISWNWEMCEYLLSGRPFISTIHGAFALNAIKWRLIFVIEKVLTVVCSTVVWIAPKKQSNRI